MTNDETRVRANILGAQPKLPKRREKRKTSALKYSKKRFVARDGKEVTIETSPEHMFLDICPIASKWGGKNPRSRRKTVGSKTTQVFLFDSEFKALKMHEALNQK